MPWVITAVHVAVAAVVTYVCSPACLRQTCSGQRSEEEASQAAPLHQEREKRGLDAGAIFFGWPGEHTCMQSVEGKPTNAKFCSITYDGMLEDVALMNISEGCLLSPISDCQ